MRKKNAVPTHTRQPRLLGIREEMLELFPRKIEEYIVNAEEICAVCSNKLKIIGKKLVRTEVEFIPAKLKVKQIIQQIVKCTECGNKDSENTKEHFQKTAIPASILSHSRATPSLVAWTMYQKFAMGISLNREESDFYRMGIVIPRSNMAHWVIKLY